MQRELLDPWYVTGLVEGEGTFTCSGAGMGGKNLCMVFGVKIQEGDKAILEQLQEFFGAGRIYHVKSRVLTEKAGAYYRVSNREELPLVLEHFDRYPLRGAKQRSYEIWR